MFMHVLDEQENTNLFTGIWLVNQYKGNDNTDLLVGLTTLV